MVGTGAFGLRTCVGVFSIGRNDIALVGVTLYVINGNPVGTPDGLSKEILEGDPDGTPDGNELMVGNGR